MASSVEAGRAFVRLLTDDSAFNRGLTKAARSLQNLGRRAALIGAGIGGLGASLAAPLALAVRQFTNVGSELVDLSGRTRIASESLSVLKYAADQTGASINDVQTAVVKMQKAIAAATEGSAAAVDLFNRLGISLSHLRLLTPDKQFAEIATAISNISDEAQQTAVLTQIFGKAGIALRPLLSDFEALTERARELGLVIDSKAAAAADKFGDLLGDISAIVKQIAFEVGAQLVPDLVVFANAIIRAGQATLKFVKENLALARGLAIAAVALKVIGGALITFGAVSFGIGYVLTVLQASIAATFAVIGSIVATVLSPVGLTIAAFLALAAIIERTSGVVSESLGQAITFVQQQLSGLTTAFGDTFRGVAAALQSGDIEAAANVLFSGLYATWLSGVELLKKAWFGLTGYLASGLATAQAGITVIWSGLQSGFASVVATLSKVRAAFVAGFKKAWAGAGEFFKQTGIDIADFLSSKFDKNYDPEAFEEQRQASAADYNKGVAEIDAQRQAATDAADKELAGKLESIAAARDKRLLEIDAAEKKRLAAGQSGVAAAQAAAQAARDKLQALADAAELSGAAIAESETKLNKPDKASDTLKTFAATGTFAGTIASRVFSGGDATSLTKQQIADARRQHFEALDEARKARTHLKAIERAARKGGGIAVT